MLLGQSEILENVLVLYARRFPLRLGKMRLVDLLWKAASGSRGSMRIAELKHGHFRMQCNLGEMLQRQYFFFGTYFLEEEILNCWEKCAHSANIVFDVGSNAGIFSLAALGVRGEAVVHAFEPTPELAHGLQQTA